MCTSTIVQNNVSEILIVYVRMYEVNFGKKPVPGFSLIFKRFTRYCMVKSKIVHE